MTATARLAEFVVKTTLRECPDGAITLVRRAVLDTLGVMLAGAAEPAARAVRQVARAEGGVPLATVVGTRLATAPGWAALANGTAGHAHDFDDTNFALMGHPSVPLLATALAAGEAETADGRLVVLAYIVGFEVSTTLGRALNPEHYTRGWHATSSIGTLGCAAAAARLLGLDVSQTRHALAIAASHASGLKENFGSMTKPYHAGHAARSGLLAAQLAREGLTASETALEGPQGYVAAFGGAGGLEPALDALGRTWQLLASGIAVKPYPSCALTHSAIDALLELRARHGIRPGDVAAVEVGVNRVVPDVLAHRQPALARGSPREVSRLRDAGAPSRRGGGRRRHARAPRGHPRHPHADLAPRGRPRLTGLDHQGETNGRARRDQDSRAGAGAAGGAAGHDAGRRGRRRAKNRDPRARPAERRRLGPAHDPHLHQPQQALDEPQHEVGRRAGDLPEARRGRRRRRRGLPPRRDEAARRRLRDPPEAQPAPRLLLALGLRPGRPVQG